jgi:hypothetical protein
MIDADFSEALDKVPAGEYAVRVVDSELKDSKAGNKYLSWTLETFGKDDDKLNGRKIWHTTPISGAGAGILRQFLTAMGIEATDRLDTDEVHGRELVVVVAEDKEGYMKVKSVKRYNSANAA